MQAHLGYFDRGEGLRVDTAFRIALRARIM